MSTALQLGLFYLFIVLFIIGLTEWAKPKSHEKPTPNKSQPKEKT